MSILFTTVLIYKSISRFLLSNKKKTFFQTLVQCLSMLKIISIWELSSLSAASNTNSSACLNVTKRAKMWIGRLSSTHTHFETGKHLYPHLLRIHSILLSLYFYLCSSRLHFVVSLSAQRLRCRAMRYCLFDFYLYSNFCLCSTIFIFDFLLLLSFASTSVDEWQPSACHMRTWQCHKNALEQCIEYAFLSYPQVINDKTRGNGKWNCL